MYDLIFPLKNSPAIINSNYYFKGSSLSWFKIEQISSDKEVSFRSESISIFESPILNSSPKFVLNVAKTTPLIVSNIYF